MPLSNVNININNVSMAYNLIRPLDGMNAEKKQ